ncbi:MAG: HlyD family type I secretion periplasmic adaptor subunit [Rhodocyclales bacterium]|nr:HlyD family type I secretion periplasmic adaptor subunit [Rhodocyclales bacterium]
MGKRLKSIRRRSRAVLAGLSPRRAFVLLTLLGAAGILLWAGLSSVDIIVRTEGRIIPAGKSQIIQHLEGGIVRQLLVQEGEIVRAGQPLMELSDVQARSSLGQEQTKLAALRGREARLLAELNGLDAIAFPADLDDAEVRRAESDAWKARRARLAEEIRVLRDQGAQKRGEIAESGSRRQNLIGELEVAQKQHRLIDGLRKNGAASELEVLDTQSRIQRLQSQIAEAGAAIPRLRAAEAESESRVSEVRARFRSEASSELTQVRADLEKSNLEVGTNADRLNRSSVRAPVSGFINRLAVSTVGGVVRPGEVLMEITPDDQRVVVEARARPNDRANLRRGLPARVRLGAYDYASFGALDGEVAEVSADTLMDEKEGRYYRVRIEAASVSVIRQPGEIVPGMTASADIVVGKRTVLSYVLSPLLRFRDGAFRDPR